MLETGLVIAMVIGWYIAYKIEKVLTSPLNFKKEDNEKVTNINVTGSNPSN